MKALDGGGAAGGREVREEHRPEPAVAELAARGGGAELLVGEGRAVVLEPVPAKKCRGATPPPLHHYTACATGPAGGGAGECDRAGPSAFSSGYPCLACQKHINCSESDGFSQQVVSSFEFGRMGWHRRPR